MKRRCSNRRRVGAEGHDCFGKIAHSRPSPLTVIRRFTIMITDASGFGEDMIVTVFYGKNSSARLKLRRRRTVRVSS